MPRKKITAKKSAGSRRRVAAELVFEIVQRRGYFRDPRVESLHDVLVRKLSLKNARKSKRAS